MGYSQDFSWFFAPMMIVTSVLLPFIIYIIKLFFAPHIKILLLFLAVINWIVIPGILLTLVLFKDQWRSLSNLLNGIVLTLSYWCLVSLFFRYWSIPLNEFTIIISYEVLIFSLGGFVLYHYFSEKARIQSYSKIWAKFKDYIQNVGQKISVILKSNSNLLLLTIFIILLSVFSILHFPFFPVEDDWYHVKLSQAFIENQKEYLSTAYRGNLSYHFIGALLTVGSGQDVLFIGRWIGLFQIPFACILFFNIMRFILPGKKRTIIAILSTILFSITALGTIINFSQFWPSALSTFLGFQLYHNFFKQIKKIQTDRILIKENQLIKIHKNSDLKIIIIQMIIIGASISTHVVNTLFFLIPIICSLTIALIRERSLLIMWITYVLGLIAQIVFNPYSLSLFLNLNLFQSSLKAIIFIIALPIIGIGLLFFERFIHSDTFNLNFMKNKLHWLPKSGFAVRFEQKYLLQLLYPTISTIVSLILILLNRQKSYRFPMNVSLILCVIFITSAIIICCYMAVILFRNYDFLGKFHYLNFFSITCLLFLLILIGTLSTFINRVLELFSFYFFIGFGFYLVYNLDKKLHNKKFQRIALGFLLFSQLIGIIYQIQFKAYISKSENAFIQTSSHLIQNDYNKSTNLIVGGFKWKHPYNYYSYYSDNIYVVDPFEDLWMNENGTIFLNPKYGKILVEMKKTNNITNIFFYYDSSYSDEGVYLTDLKYFGVLSNSQLIFYLNNGDLNRVAVGGKEQHVLYCFIDS
ncbi:hypothetical protein [Candidatus Harpocratesius sp.]